MQTEYEMLRSLVGAARWLRDAWESGHFKGIDEVGDEAIIDVIYCVDNIDKYEKTKHASDPVPKAS